MYFVIFLFNVFFILILKWFAHYACDKRVDIYNRVDIYKRVDKS